MHRSRSKTRPEMHVVLSDQHIPYQDKTIEQMTLSFIKEHRPSAIHLLGDILDFYQLSRFDKDPARATRVESDLEDAQLYFNRIRKVAPRTPIIYSLGNHEIRFRRFLHANAKELAGLDCLDFKKLLNLEHFNIKLVDEMHPYYVGKLLFTHGEVVRKWSGASARGNYEKFGGNVICGHVHRLGAFYHTTMEGSYGAWENGCLCTLKPEYMIAPDWQNGWSVVWKMANGYFHVDQICVDRYQYVYQGKLKRAKRIIR